MYEFQADAIEPLLFILSAGGELDSIVGRMKVAEDIPGSIRLREMPVVKIVHTGGETGLPAGAVNRHPETVVIDARVQGVEGSIQLPMHGGPQQCGVIVCGSCVIGEYRIVDASQGRELGCRGKSEKIVDGVASQGLCGKTVQSQKKENGGNQPHGHEVFLSSFMLTMPIPGPVASSLQN